MLEITIPAKEMWNEDRNEFVVTNEQTLRLEHSLVSLSKWEAKWQKPFLAKEQKTRAETIDYIRCMTLTQNVPDEVYMCLSNDNIRAVNAYIESPQTATSINDSERSGGGGESVTSELVYYWMILYGVPFECQKWHLNRLLTLIRICNIKSRKPKPMKQEQIIRQYADLNAARRMKYNSKG